MSVYIFKMYCFKLLQITVYSRETIAFKQKFMHKNRQTTDRCIDKVDRQINGQKDSYMYRQMDRRMNKCIDEMRDG